jgi:S-adenosylmethionine hydrolase
MNQIVTLLSDWRLRDPYVAMLKGMILQTMPDAQVIDITHYVDKFNTLQTALLMKTSYVSFPEGTIHLILTNMSLNSTFSPVLLSHDGHYFIGEDNGVFHLMFGQFGLLKGLQLSENKGDTLSQMMLLAKAIKEDSLSQLTTEYAQFKRMFVELPDHEADNKQIEGHIIYIDAFNNAMTDIPTAMFEKAVQGRPFSATILSKGTWTITKYYEGYRMSEGEMFLCNNSLGLIEVAAYQADVAVLADLEPGDKIIIKYE